MKVKELKAWLEEQNPESDIVPEMDCFHGKVVIAAEDEEHFIEDRIEIE